MKKILCFCVLLAAAVPSWASETLSLSARPSPVAAKLLQVLAELRWGVASGDEVTGSYVFETADRKLTGRASIRAVEGGGTALVLSFTETESGEPANRKVEQKACKRIFGAMRSLGTIDSSQQTAVSPPAADLDVKILAAKLRVKSRMVQDMVSAGYALAGESEHQLVFVQDRAVKQGLWDYALYGRYLATGQRFGIVFLLFDDDGATVVKAQGAIYTWNGYGWVTARNLMDDVAASAQIRNYLQALKSRLEIKPPIPPPSPAAN